MITRTCLIVTLYVYFLCCVDVKGDLLFRLNGILYAEGTVGLALKHSPLFVSESLDISLIVSIYLLVRFNLVGWLLRRRKACLNLKSI